MLNTFIKYSTLANKPNHKTEDALVKQVVSTRCHGNARINMFISLSAAIPIINICRKTKDENE